MHAFFKRFKGNLFMLFLPVLDFLQDVPHVELHAPDERHLKHKGSHEVIENIAAFLLKVNVLIFFEFPEDLVVSHG